MRREILNSFRLYSLAAVITGLIFVTSASAQNVSVVSGNGQVLGGSNFILQPLVVQVTDATTGFPVGAGVAVNWQASGFNGFFLASGTPQATIGTDANGVSTAYYQLPATVNTLNVTSPFVQSTVTATAGNTATFAVTQLASAPTLSIAPFIIIVQSNLQSLGSPLKGAVGTNGPAITFQVGAGNGQSTQVLPNVAVELLNFEDPTQGPLVACASSLSSGAGLNTTLTDANGMVTCTPVYGGLPGTGEFVVTVGGIQTATNSPAGYWQSLLDPTDLTTLPNVQTAWILNLIPIRINVTPGAAGSIRIVSPQGGTQSVTAGTSVQLIVETDNTAGSPLSGSTVNWTVVSPASGATLSSATTTAGPSGQAINNLSIFSSVSGLVQVKATLANDATKFVTFSISVSAPITVTQFQIVSGSNQSAIVNSSFGQPLVVKVSTSAGPGANIPVQFAVLAGSVFLSATSVNTDSSGIAQVFVTAGPVTGGASVVASLSSSAGIGSVSFALTVLSQAPSVTAANFVNGADFQPNSLSPCGLGALVVSAGTLAVPSISPTFPGGPVPSSTVQLSFANIGAPILNIGNNAAGQQQVLFQVPCEVAPGGAVPVTLSVGGAVSNINLNVLPASPGVFQTLMSDGVFRAVIVRPDGSYVSLSNPARLGETVAAYVTGLGPTTPGVSTHSVPAPGGTAMVQGTVVPGMAGGGALLISAQLSEDLPGIYVVTFQIPTGVPTGNDTTFSIGVIPPGSSTVYYSAISKVPVHQ
jgi:uncharacterized protein (TIGR03437 family)